MEVLLCILLFLIAGSLLGIVLTLPDIVALLEEQNRILRGDYKGDSENETDSDDSED